MAGAGMDDNALIDAAARNPAAALIALAFGLVLVLVRKEIARAVASFGSESALEALMVKNLQHFEALEKQAESWVKAQDQSNRHLERNRELMTELLQVQQRILEEIIRQNAKG